MKEYIKQFYTEGFATTFYQKPINFLLTINKVVFKILFKLTMHHSELKNQGFGAYM